MVKTVIIPYINTNHSELDSFVFNNPERLLRIYSVNEELKEEFGVPYNISSQGIDLDIICRIDGGNDFLSGKKLLGGLYGHVMPSLFPNTIFDQLSYFRTSTNNLCLDVTKTIMIPEFDVSSNLFAHMKAFGYNIVLLNEDFSKLYDYKDNVVEGVKNEAGVYRVSGGFSEYDMAGIVCASGSVRGAFLSGLRGINVESFASQLAHSQELAERKGYPVNVFLTDAEAVYINDIKGVAYDNLRRMYEKVFDFIVNGEIDIRELNEDLEKRILDCAFNNADSLVLGQRPLKKWRKQLDKDNLLDCVDILYEEKYPEMTQIQKRLLLGIGQSSDFLSAYAGICTGNSNLDSKGFNGIAQLPILSNDGEIDERVIIRSDEKRIDETKKVLGILNGNDIDLSNSNKLKLIMEGVNY